MKHFLLFFVYIDIGGQELTSSRGCGIMIVIEGGAHMEQSTKIGLTGNMLKIIAMVAMLTDHVGLYLFPGVAVFRAIGRIAFPIFAFMIAEGYTYTGNRLRYFLMIAGLGTLCQIVTTIAERTLHQGILITFSLAIAAIFLTEMFWNRQRVLYRILAAIGLTLIVFTVLAAYLFPPFWIDYGAFGVFLPVLIYYIKGRKQKVLGMAVGIAVHALTASTVQWCSLFAIPLLFLYDGTRGKAKLKYLFYVFYPTHLVLLYLVAAFFFH